MRILALAIAYAFLSLGLAPNVRALTDCGPEKPLEQVVREAEVVLLGEFASSEVAGTELCDGTLKPPTTPVVIGECYRNAAFRTTFNVSRVLAGSAAKEVTIVASFPILNLGNCPTRSVVQGIPAVVALSKRNGQLWVHGGQEGLLYLDPFEVESRVAWLETVLKGRK